MEIPVSAFCLQHILSAVAASEELMEQAKFMEVYDCHLVASKENELGFGSSEAIKK